MGLRTLRMASICLALTVAALPAATGEVVRDDPDPPSCLSVYKGSSTSGEASVGVSLPGDPKDSLFFQAEVVAPETEGTNGTKVSVYASPLFCV